MVLPFESPVTLLDLLVSLVSEREKNARCGDVLNLLLKMNSGISQNDLAVLVNFVCWNGVLFIMRLIAFFLFWFLLKEKG